MDLPFNAPVFRYNNKYKNVHLKEYAKDRSLIIGVYLAVMPTDLPKRWLRSHILFYFRYFSRKGRTKQDLKDV